MKSLVKINILLLVLLMLSACLAAEYFIKRAVNDFEGDIVNELTSLADFSSEQQALIITLADSIDSWMRTERLPVLQSALLSLAEDIELQGQIKPSNWNSIVDQMQLGLQTSEAPNLIAQYSELAVGLTDKQIEQISQSIDDELQESLAKSKDRRIDKQTERIVDALKWIFRAVDKPLSSKQRKFAKEFLADRKVDFDYQEQVRINEKNRFIEIMTQANNIDKSQLNADIKVYLSQIENSRAVPNLEDWRYNRDVFLDLLNQLIADLNTKQQREMAIKLKEYEGVFAELANAD